MISFRSEIVIKVLGYYFLNPNARHYVRELAALLKVDPGNLSRKMSELKETGIFLAEGAGRNRYFQLNQHFPLLKEYKTIYESRFGVVESLKDVLANIKGLSEAYIFGSYAKGGFEEGSDIDLLLIGSHDYSQARRALSGLEKKWHREINAVDFSRREFSARLKKKDFFLANIFSAKTIRII